jgi:hypothetical protein
LPNPARIANWPRSKLLLEFLIEKNGGGGILTR